MSEKELPHKVDAYRFADNEIALQGTLKVRDMQRLAGYLADDTGNINVNITFGRDEQKIRFMRGEFEAHVTLQCQRCLEPFEYPILGRILLGMVESEEEVNHLPKGYDSVFIKEGMLIIPEVIEDELIVSLPLVPMHPLVDCKVKLPLEIGSEKREESEKENPFKVIELLRSKRNSNED